VTSDSTDPRAAKTRTRALEAAEHLLFTEGLARVTFDGVRKETGISRSTLYRHWARPVDLVVEVWERNTRASDFPHTNNLHNDLVTALKSTVSFLEHTPLGKCISTLIDMAAHDPDMAELHASFTMQRRKPAATRLKHAIKNGELEPDTDVNQTIDLLFGPIFYRHLLSHSPTSSAYIDALTTRVINNAQTTHFGSGRL
jgi:AcrR family transcriptional regulator